MRHHYHITKSNFDYLVVITHELYSTFLCFCEVYYYSFTSTQGTSFTVPLKINQLMMNSFSFCLGKSLYFIHFWRTDLPGIELLSDGFFTLYIFNILYMYIISFSPGLKDICWEILWYSYVSTHLWNFCLLLLSKFFLCRWFWTT